MSLMCETCKCTTDGVTGCDNGCTCCNTVASLLENPPTYAEGVAALIEWSGNFDTHRAPVDIFLGLLGYEGYEDLTLSDYRMGYVELSKIAAALEEYANRPQDIKDYLDKLATASLAE